MKYLYLSFLLFTGLSYGQIYQSWKTEDLSSGDTLLLDYDEKHELHGRRWNEVSTQSHQFLIDFFDYHNEVTSFQIINHVSYRGNAEYNLSMTEQRASNLKNAIASSLDNIHIKAKGYGESIPYKILLDNDSTQVLDEKYILSMQNQEEKEKLHKKNNRYEIVILKVDTSNYNKKLYLDMRFSEPQKERLYKAPIIYFDLAKHYLQQNEEVNSVDSIKAIADFMNKHPKMVMEIGVHTDCRGSDHYSTRLSQRRAQSIRDCLIAVYGITEERLVARGYEETKPFQYYNKNNELIALTCDYIVHLENKEEQERMHQMNRRTELKVLSFDFIPEE
jgi:outer membrane protein OmpA-like peptidoglycan-associated protein